MNIFRILVFILLFPFVFLFLIGKNTFVNTNMFALKNDNSDNNYHLAKEYYFFKNKKVLNLDSNTLISNPNYIDFAKKYEMNYRIFENNWNNIQIYNSQGYNLKINKFADIVDFSDDSFHSDLMKKPIITNNKERRITLISKIKNFYQSITSNHPKEIDWRKTTYLSKVKNQQNCGSCWAFSSTGAIETFLRKNNFKVDRLSEQELVDCSKENFGCQGGFMDKAFDYCIENNGLYSETNYPYLATDNECMNGCKVESKNCTSIDKVYGSSMFDYKFTEPYSINSLKDAVIKNPVCIAINANTPIFRFYSDGIIEDDQNIKPQLNHAVLLVGYNYDKKGLYWIVQNSWGKDWGDKGYFKLRGKEGEGVLSCQIYGIYPIKENK